MHRFGLKTSSVSAFRADYYTFFKYCIAVELDELDNGFVVLTFVVFCDY